MMGRLGYDIDLDKFNDAEWKFSQQAVVNYKRLYPVISHGDLYRLISPYNENRAVLMYVDSLQTKAVLFSYNLHVRYGEDFEPVKLQGLNPVKKYTLKEINIEGGKSSALNNKSYSGDYLMKVGLPVSPRRELSSMVIELYAE
jgi:alpha-galactosidase